MAGHGPGRFYRQQQSLQGASGLEPERATGNARSLLDSYRLDPNDPTLFDVEQPVMLKRKVALALTLLVIGTVLVAVGVTEFLNGVDGGELCCLLGFRQWLSCTICAMNSPVR
jgi:hypothetical protein